MIETPSGGVPEKAPRWDLKGTEACGGEKVFLVCPLVYGEYLGIYRAGIRVRGSRGAHLRGCLMVQEKSSKSFVLFVLHLVLIFCKDKNKGKTTTGTGH